MALTRRFGETGIQWIFNLVDNGTPVDLTTAEFVTLEISNGTTVQLTISDAAGGIATFTNISSDLAVGKYTYTIFIFRGAGGEWRSQPRELEILQPT